MRPLSAAVFAVLLASVQLSGQTVSVRPFGSVHLTVRDVTGLPVPGAYIALTVSDGSKLTSTTNDRGEAAFDGVRIGVCSGVVAAAGFSAFAIEPFTIGPDDRIARTVTLQLPALVEEISVVPTADDQVLVDAFGTQLTPDQLVALPEDPEELAVVLQQLVGADADIRVDGFSGGRLPSGTQIQSVRIRYDVGAASSGAGPRVEISTAPGGDRLRNNATMSVRDEALSGRDAFSGRRPVGQTQQYSWNLNVPVVRNRTGLSVSVDGASSMGNQSIHAATPAGIYTELLEQPSNALGIWTRLEHRLNSSQSIRADFGHHGGEALNQGIGQFDLPERALTRNESQSELRIGHHATIRRRWVNDLRLTLGRESTEASPVKNAPTIRVLDAFADGGADERGGRTSTTLDFGEELQFSFRRLHQITAGVSISGGNYQGNETDNSLGTFTFASLASFDAHAPETFTQRIGDPNYSYSMYRFGSYIQDDYRIRRNLMVNLGFRHDFQTHMRDWVNLSPRIGASWTPSLKSRTTLRGSLGLFYLPLDAGTYQRITLVDGVRQRDLVIASPGYPDPFSAGTTEVGALPSIIRAKADLDSPSQRRYTLGVDQPIGKLFRFRSTFVHQTGHNLWRSRNANAPVNGIRPNASFLNITELETTGRSQNDSLQAELSVSYPPRRLSAGINYALGSAMDEADGPFSLPPDSNDVTREWGPAFGDVRHRVNASLNTDLPAHFRISANFRAQSASPYNVTTGIDSNGDGVPNERPAGVGRNSARGEWTRNLDINVAWSLGIGQRRPIPGSTDDGPSVAGGQSRVRPDMSPSKARDNAVVRLEIFARAANALNLVNHQTFSGVITSPFFGLPTSAGAARRLVLGTRVWF